MKELPERVYLFDCNDVLMTKSEGDTEYIRKDVVDDMLATAEDHAYFAGSEKARERVTEEAIRFFTPHIQDNSGGYERAAFIEEFKRVMKKNRI